jgi:hypothetical protein
LKELDYFPADYFELWDTYEKYASKKSKQNIKKTNLIIHAEKNGEGKSVHSLEVNKKIHSEKNEEGKSVVAVKAGAASMAATTPEQRSERARKASKITHARKNSEGKSIHASEMGKKGGRKGGLATSKQVWESLEDGFRGSATNVARHNRAKGWDPDARFRVK